MPKIVGKLFKWIALRNSYVPVVSTVTGIGKAILGLGMGLEGTVQYICGLAGLCLSIFVPAARPPTRFQKRNMERVKDGLARIITGAQEILRAIVSAVPVIGNLVVWCADKAIKQSDPRSIADPLIKLCSDPDANALEKKIAEMAKKTLRD